MGNTALLTIGTNVLSSVVSEIMKMFIAKNYEPLTKQEISSVINKINNKLDKIVIKQDNIEEQINYLLIENQNLMIQNQKLMQLLFKILNEYAKICIQNTKNGYYIEGENTLNKQVLACSNELYLLPGTKTVLPPISTYEFKRHILIGIQIKTLLDAFTSDSDECKVLIQYAVEKRYIKSIIFYAMRSEKSYFEIEVFIDWKEYQNQINRGNITIKTQSKKGILSRTKKIVTVTREYLNKNRFSIKWRFKYADNVNKESLNIMLGTRNSDIIKRAERFSNQIIFSRQVGELNEATYIIRA